MKRVSIPGKVMLSGEYAVLYGGTAVLMPVPRYLDLTQTELPPVNSYKPVVTVSREFPIAEIADHEKKHGLPHISIDYTQFYHTDASGNSVKLGLGSSSAEAVGVIALRYECAGIPWRERIDDVTRCAFEAHRKAQGGKGSGADVAACAYRVPIRYRMVGDSFEVIPVKRIKEINAIPLALAFSGIPADTRILVKKFESWVERGNDEAKGHLQNLIKASEHLAGAWFCVSTYRLFEVLGEFMEILNVCAKAATISYRLPIHEKVESWAIQHGGMAKPTGAGGGDLILLLGSLPHDQLEMPIIPLTIKSS